MAGAGHAYPQWEDTPSRGGRTLLPFVPGVNQECPPLAKSVPLTAGELFV